MCEGIRYLIILDSAEIKHKIARGYVPLGNAEPEVNTT